MLQNIKRLLILMAVITVSANASLTLFTTTESTSQTAFTAAKIALVSYYGTRFVDSDIVSLVKYKTCKSCVKFRFKMNAEQSNQSGTVVVTLVK